MFLWQIVVMSIQVVLATSENKLSPLNVSENLIRNIKQQNQESSNRKLSPAFKKNWGLSRIGFSQFFSNVSGPHAKSCSEEVVVAIIDTGIDVHHPDLVGNIWLNNGETGEWKPSNIASTLCRDKSCNGIDDDNNGKVDDFMGWNFVHNDNLPLDTHGHGSHIAGIINAAAKNGASMNGFCPSVKYMVLKYYDPYSLGFKNLTNTVEAIRYAIRMGAHIINYSGGGSQASEEERKAIAEAEKQGILFVAAAGNDGKNNDNLPYYPASYDLENIISVAATNEQDTLLSTSNYGVDKVDVAAPGLSIYSTLHRHDYDLMSGTSQSTAFTSGLAALLMSQLPSKERASYDTLKRWITSGAEPITASREGRRIKYGRISLPRSLVVMQKDRSQILQAGIAVKTSEKKSINKLGF